MPLRPNLVRDVSRLLVAGFVQLLATPFKLFVKMAFLSGPGLLGENFLAHNHADASGVSAKAVAASSSGTMNR